jgi:putative FmdB family regulatory protein
MPTYDYECDACAHEFEEFQSFSEKPLTKCPKCGKKKLRRLFGTGAGVIFKGSGFYETDYRSDSYKQAAKAEKEKDGGTGGEGKTTAKDSAGSTSSPAQKNGSGETTKAKESGKSPKSTSRKTDD